MVAAALLPLPLPLPLLTPMLMLLAVVTRKAGEKASKEGSCLEVARRL